MFPIHRKIIFCLLIVAAVISSGGTAFTQGTCSLVDNRPAAMVNGTPIPRGEVMKEFTRVRGYLTQMGRRLSEEDGDRIMTGVLEKKIHEELLYQESQRRGVVADTEEIDAAVDNFRSAFDSDEDFQSILKSLNKTEESLRAEYARRLALKHFIDRFFWDDVSVSEEELSRYFTAHRALFKDPAKVRYRRILISVPKEAAGVDKAAAKKRIEEVKKLVDAGGDFAGLARGFSDGMHAEDGGDCGFVEWSQGLTALEKQAFSLSSGEVSNIISLPEGYAVIKVEENRPAKDPTLDDVHDRVQTMVERQAVNRELNAFVLKLKEKAEIDRYLVNK